MKHWIKVTYTILFMIVITGGWGASLAQAPQSGQEKPQEEKGTGQIMIHKVDEGAMPHDFAANTYFFLKSEGSFESGLVKGAPYSAQGVTTFTQTLSDGNRITRQTSSQIYRDSEGRTRREETITAIGPWASSTDAPQIIHIHDPVAGVGYTLNPKDHSAAKMVIKVRTEKSGTGPGTPAAVMIKPPLPPAPMDAHMAIARLEHSGAEPGVDVKNESLGSQMFEGVQADGTRTTVTIPAGRIGNELPILVVSERWYSQELHAVLMSKRSDPRTGDEVYRLTNINRSEPAHQLFEVPSDYTLREDKNFMQTFRYNMAPNPLKKENKE